MKAVIGLAAVVILLQPAGAANFVVRSLDGPGEGLNDLTPFVAAGGNNATTLGQARMNVLQEAGRVWGALLQSNVDIIVDAEFSALTCSTNTGVLGQAAPRSLLTNFPNIPTPNVYYVNALADSLAGENRSAPGTEDIGVEINSNVDSDPNCLMGRGFYYGLDHNRGNRVDLLTVLLHEFGHGLGFISAVNSETGETFIVVGGVDRFSSFAHQLFDETLGRSWPLMTASERAASAVRTGSLAWNGSRANAHLGRFVAGGTANGRFRMYAPATVSSGSSVSHWDTAVTPSALMEPNLPSVISIGAVDVTACALEDMGWRVTRCPDDAPVNVAPIANSQTVTVAEDSSIVVTLTGSDANNDSLTFTLSALAIAGTVSPISATPPHTVTYSPSGNFNGNDSFKFFVSDGTVSSAPATITITVTPVNDAPSANAATIAAITAQPTAVNLIGSDVDGDSLSFTVVGNPSSGTLTGSVPALSYQSNAGFVGTDSFTYRVSDGTLNSSTATVTINVTAPAAASAPSGGGGGGGGAFGTGALLALLALSATRVRRRQFTIDQK